MFVSLAVLCACAACHPRSVWQVRTGLIDIVADEWVSERERGGVREQPALFVGWGFQSGGRTLLTAPHGVLDSCASAVTCHCPPSLHSVPSFVRSFVRSLARSSVRPSVHVGI